MSTCDHALAPDRPDAGDGPSIGALVFAAKDMRIDNAELDVGVAPALSLDLDTTCSCGEPPSCLAPPDAGTPCDGPNGRDNVAGAQLANLALLTPTLDPAYLRNNIAVGQFTVLLSLQKWNGTPNDPEVLVNMLMSVGTEDDSQGRHKRPLFDGTDVWDVDPASILNGGNILGQKCSEAGCIGRSDLNAYVRDGFLVANIEVINLSLGIEAKRRLDLPFRGARVVAELVPEGGSWRLRGQVAGRMPTNELLKALTALRDPLLGTSLCGSSETYTSFKRGVCGAADLAATPGEDRTGVTCSAISAAAAFDSVTAQLGIVKVPGTSPSECPDFNDTCPQ